MDILLAVLAYIAAVEIPTVLGVIAAPNHIKTAKVLIWSAAIPLGIWCFVWELSTEAPMAIRIIVGLLVGAFIFVLVPETVRWMKASGAEKPPGTPSNTMGDVTGNRGIVTQGQRGD